MTKVIAVVPARSGSKGVIGKNRKYVGNWNLVQRAVKYGMDSLLLDGIVVSSDSIEILDFAASVADHTQIFNNYKDFVLASLERKDTESLLPILLQHRSNRLSQDSTRIVELLKALLLEVENLRIVEEEIFFLLLQPTSPFREIDEIDRFLESTQIDNRFRNAISVRRIEDEHPARMYTSENGNLKNINLFRSYEFAPRQELPEVFLRDGGYYLVNSELVKKGIMVAEDSQYFVRNFPNTLNIDKEQDLIFANFLIKYGYFIENLS